MKVISWVFRVFMLPLLIFLLGLTVVGGLLVRYLPDSSFKGLDPQSYVNVLQVKAFLKTFIPDDFFGWLFSFLGKFLSSIGEFAVSAKPLTEKLMLLWQDPSFVPGLISLVLSAMIVVLLWNGWKITQRGQWGKTLSGGAKMVSNVPGPILLAFALMGVGLLLAMVSVLSIYTTFNHTVIIRVVVICAFIMVLYFGYETVDDKIREWGGAAMAILVGSIILLIVVGAVFGPQVSDKATGAIRDLVMTLFTTAVPAITDVGQEALSTLTPPEWTLFAGLGFLLIGYIVFDNSRELLDGGDGVEHAHSQQHSNGPTRASR